MLRYILRDRLSVRYVTRGFDVSMLLLFFCLLFSNRIISVMDGSLPKKPCKTCKNRFHAGCLYKVCLFFFFLSRHATTFSAVVQLESFLELSFMSF